MPEEVTNLSKVLEGSVSSKILLHASEELAETGSFRYAPVQRQNAVVAMFLYDRPKIKDFLEEAEEKSQMGKWRTQSDQLATYSNDFQWLCSVGILQ